jgi:predicted TIM-barrel fold metal-dependent hydrolase
VIVDTHCHAWETWPYTPAVPDPESRGRVEQLLHEMDINGVDQALIVCAQIEHNLENNAYIAEQVRRHPDRLRMLADLDCSWSPTYHTPGAAERLRRMAERFPLTGFTHYLKNDDDGSWLHEVEGQAVFQAAGEQGLLASIACRPHQHPALRRAAAAHSEVPVLVHHLGLVTQGDNDPKANLEQVLASAEVPNIYIKVSGFAYAAAVKWDFPYKDTHWIVKGLYERYGPTRLCWGSDYPVVRFFMTYRQALEAFRTHCDFIPEIDQKMILGNTAVVR